MILKKSTDHGGKIKTNCEKTSRRSGNYRPVDNKKHSKEKKHNRVSENQRMDLPSEPNAIVGKTTGNKKLPITR